MVQTISYIYSYNFLIADKIFSKNTVNDTNTTVPTMVHHSFWLSGEKLQLIYDVWDFCFRSFIEMMAIIISSLKN